MKTYIVYFALLLLAAMPLFGQAPITASFSPSMVQVNSFNTASFDPTQPHTQPILTTLIVSNNGNESTYINLKIDVKWNGINLTNAEFVSVEPLQPGAPLYLSNRDLITTSASSHFNEIGVGGVSLEDVIDASPVLRSAVLAGFFPDGTITLEVSVKPQSAGSYPAPSVFSIVVRNPGTINLISPGVAIGSNPQQVNNPSLSFFWNALSTDFNDYYLTLREFPSNAPPNPGNVELIGNTIYQSPMPISGNNLSELMPLVPGNYYAWKVSTQIYTETSPRIRSGAGGRLDSNWFVFRYMPAQDSPAITMSELQALLVSLGSPEMEALFNGGFVPIGTVQAEGQNYTGEEALNLIRGLFGRNIIVEIRN